MRHRMIGAALSLVGLFVALYLWLWKLGYFGAIACGSGGCETVQLSEYAVVLGVPVAFYGVVGYLAMLAVSLIGLHGAPAERRWPTVALLVLAGGGVAFTAYLTYLEAAVIHAWCRWCVGSAVIVTLIFLTALVGYVRHARERAG